LGRAPIGRSIQVVNVSFDVHGQIHAAPTHAPLVAPAPTARERRFS